MIRRFLAPFSLVALLSGCISIGGGSKAPDQLITFTAREVAEPGSGVSSEIDDAIVVFVPEVEDRLDVNRVPVQVSDTGVAYLKDATYIDRPARLFQHLLAETLRARSGRLVIEGEDPGVQTRTRLYSRLIEAGYDARTSEVTVTFDLSVAAPDGSVRQHRFSDSIGDVPAKAAFVAPALNDAANAVAGEAADWLVGQPDEGTDQPS